ncbi:MAG: HlyD family secretion protein [Cryomorphaceae bacterium]|jgi:HlyD family secretion protein
MRINTKSKTKLLSQPLGGVFLRVTMGVVILAIAAGGIWYWNQDKETGIPPGIVYGNGRIEADQVDIATKYPGRVVSISVIEGDMVEPGQVLALMDTAEMETQLAKAQAQLATTEESILEAKAVITERQSAVKLAEQEVARALPLVEKGSLAKRVLEQRQSRRDSAKAGLKAAQAHLKTIESSVDVAKAGVNQVQTQLDECVLKSTVKGRVLYRLAEEGEVLGAGGKLLTVLDLSDVYMEVFLPSGSAGKISIGAEARITIDAASSEYAIPALVSFVSPEAQFTPKQVETLSERQKLMFRVKIRIPHELVLRHIKKVKTGVRGIGYIRLDDTVVWPANLEKRYPGDPQ